MELREILSGLIILFVLFWYVRFAIYLFRKVGHNYHIMKNFHLAPRVLLELQRFELELQSLQSREYDSPKEIVFPSIISLLQDTGFTISNADIQTGLIYAEGSLISDAGLKFWLRITKVTHLRATAFVEQIGDKTRARLNFVEVNQTSSRYGHTDRQDTVLSNAELYQNAFEKIENAIVIRSQK